MTVRAILDTKGHQVESIQPGAKLSAAVKALGEKRIGAILVLNVAGHIEGILSERDIVRVLAERGAAVLDEPVSAVMTKKVVTCRAAELIDHGARATERALDSIQEAIEILAPPSEPAPAKEQE